MKLFALTLLTFAIFSMPIVFADIRMPAETTPAQCAEAMARKLVHESGFSDIDLSDFAPAYKIPILDFVSWGTSHYQFKGHDHLGNEFHGYVLTTAKTRVDEELRTGERKAYIDCKLTKFRWRKNRHSFSLRDKSETELLHY